MTVDEAIAMLQSEKKAGIKNLIVAWWDASMFGRIDDDDWASVAQIVEDKMDWSSAHEDMQDLINYIESDEGP